MGYDYEAGGIKGAFARFAISSTGWTRTPPDHMVEPKMVRGPEHQFEGVALTLLPLCNV
jgi:hypothetical protein